MIEKFVIPELEDLARNWRDPKDWTDAQLAALDRYYGRVPMTRLREHVRHSFPIIHRKAQEIGITLPRPPLDPEDADE